MLTNFGTALFLNFPLGFEDAWKFCRRKLWCALFWQWTFLLLLVFAVHLSHRLNEMSRRQSKNQWWSFEMNETVNVDYLLRWKVRAWLFRAWQCIWIRIQIKFYLTNQVSFRQYLYNVHEFHQLKDLILKIPNKSNFAYSWILNVR